MNLVYLLDVSFEVRSSLSDGVLAYCPALEGEIQDVLLAEAIGDTEEIDNVPSLLLAVRGDLERLADEHLGVNIRPEGWLDNTDIESETFSIDLFADVERLANEILGFGIRPSAWVTSASGSETATFRTLRFNIELLADIRIGEGIRPGGWQGESPLFTCNPVVQNLVFLTERAYNYQLPDPDTLTVPFCDVVTRTVNLLVENPPEPESEEVLILEEIRYSSESRNAFAYLDQAALEYLGVMPYGTGFRAWYRNFGGSSMMFVSGDDFALFIDRRWTDLPEEVFNTLPTLDGVRPLTFCDATWCNGPGPTPTPTGSGPILDIIAANTPPAALQQIGTPADSTTKELVSWNHLRVTYLLFRQDVGRVQIALEICTLPVQVACEPVLSVFDNLTGLPVPSISQYNGLNVYELPFGYSTNYIIEGLNLFSRDIWLNDPTLQSP